MHQDSARPSASQPIRSAGKGRRGASCAAGRQSSGLAGGGTKVGGATEGSLRQSRRPFHAEFELASLLAS